jgi:predicted O-methyltransferase YrrM
MHSHVEGRPRVGKVFSCDYTTPHTKIWRRVLAPWRSRRVRVLEIGTWEGRSAVYFLNFLYQCNITCVDTFRGSLSLLALPEHRKWVRQLPYTEARFNRNVAQFGNRVKKIKGQSVPVLDALIARRCRYDVIYLDASHRYNDVAADSTRAWKLLRKGGVLIWDDYGWRPEYPSSERPKDAIDAFLDGHKQSYILLEKDYQVIIRRRRE